MKLNLFKIEDLLGEYLENKEYYFHFISYLNKVLSYDFVAKSSNGVSYKMGESYIENCEILESEAERITKERFLDEVSNCLKYIKDNQFYSLEEKYINIAKEITKRCEL